jgi:hypothetical protein
MTAMEKMQTKRNKDSTKEASSLQKTNYCDSSGLMSQCLVRIHNKQPLDCQFFVPSSRNEKRCMYLREYSNDFCDCLIAQVGFKKE